MKTALFSFIAALILTGCAAQKPEPQNPLKSTAQKVEVKNEIRAELGLPVPPAIALKELEQITVFRPETPVRRDEKIMRGLMLPYTEGNLKWGASYVYDVLVERGWKYDNELQPPQNSDMMGGIN